MKKEDKSEIICFEESDNSRSYDDKTSLSHRNEILAMRKTGFINIITLELIGSKKKKIVIKNKKNWCKVRGDPQMTLRLRKNIEVLNLDTGRFRAFLMAA